MLHSALQIPFGGCLIYEPPLDTLVRENACRPSVKPRAHPEKIAGLDVHILLLYFWKCRVRERLP